MNLPVESLQRELLINGWKVLKLNQNDEGIMSEGFLNFFDLLNNMYVQNFGYSEVIR